MLFFAMFLETTPFSLLSSSKIAQKTWDPHPLVHGVWAGVVDDLAE